MADDLETMPMDVMDEAPAVEQPQEQQPERPRDEGGRFAPKQGDDAPARGKPDPEAAARRERAERDEARREAAEAKENYAKLQKRLDDMAAFAKGEEPADDKPADPLKPLLEKVEAIDQRLTQADQTREIEEAWVQVRSYADEHERQFAAQHPDFSQAIQYLIQSLSQEALINGVAEEEVGPALQAWAEQRLVASYQRKLNPAQMLYQQAQSRGYQASSQPGNVVQMQQPRNVGGRSLGNSGSPAGGGITAQQIASMSEEDYFAFRNTPEGRRAIKRAMGG
jgi:hypothetical protein